MKRRLDQALVARGLVATRSQAESYIRMGDVLVNGSVVTKPGFAVGDEHKIVLKTPEQYVNRAALKLASVAQALKLDFKGRTVLDVGSSTGGFTEYVLRHGAVKVIDVDVGTNQLHPSLRPDPRIELHEQTDIRDVRRRRHVESSKEQVAREEVPKGHFEGKTDTSRGGAMAQARMDGQLVPDSAQRAGGMPGRRGGAVEIAVPDMVVIDVSFISLREILPHVAKLVTRDSLIVAMVKPQFEAGQRSLKHKGVIKNDTMRRDILKDFEDWARQRFIILDKADSQVAGTKGNLERFYLLRKM